jgi:uncharacterized protein
MSIEESPIHPDDIALVTDEVPPESPNIPSVASDVDPDFATITAKSLEHPEIASGPAPVEAAARLGAVDVLRGVALLGILAMNIVHFAWPMEVYSTPTAAPGSTWGDMALWMFNHIVFDTKMMTIFSMLFGAGLVLMSDRADAKGASLRRIYYRRVTFLLMIGLVHAYLIWDGDILVPYALCGFLLYPLRHKSPRTLITIAVILFAMAIPVWLGTRVAIRSMAATYASVEAEIKEGKTPSGWRKNVHEIWQKINEDETKKAENFQKTIDNHRGGYAGIVAKRAGELVFEQTIGFLLGFWWLVGGRMLLGMGLMKLGVFSAERSTRFYQRLALIGYGVGFPLVLADIAVDLKHDFFVNEAIRYVTGGWWLINSVSSPFIALGHVAVVMLIYKSGALGWLTRRLAAVGRMALSNYLFDSILCSTLFYGYGLGLYGTIHRPGLYLIVLAIWAFQLWISPIWLARFRFGPAEWLWRSLTYGEPQPFRRRDVPVAALA